MSSTKKPNPQTPGSNPPCTPHWIDQLLEGELSPRDQARFEEHLTACSRCERRLHAKTASDVFWHDAGDFLRSTEVRPEEPERVWTVDFAPLLDPTDDPRMLGRFAGYEIAGVVGRGGMGIVMKGFDHSLNRFVAIKILNPSMASLSAAGKRFAREAQAAAAVVHDNVIAIFGVDHWHDLPYLVMPYVKGQSLQNRIDRTAPMSVENALEVSLQIARGLSAAHEQGLIHRDIKPANILLPESVSRIVITDFGLARAADDASLTQSGIIAGTPEYMSPEQAKGHSIDPRTDLFSLGSVMYAMLTGRPPFRADTSYGVLHRINHEKHHSLSSINADVPEWLERLVDRLLAKAPEERFASALHLAEHLEDCLAHLRQPITKILPVLPDDNCPASQPSRSAPRRWVVAVMMMLIVFSAILLSMRGWPSNSRQPNTEPTTQSPPDSLNSDSTYPKSAWGSHLHDSDWVMKLDLEIGRIEKEVQALSVELSRPFW